MLQPDEDCYTFTQQNWWFGNVSAEMAWISENSVAMAVIYGLRNHAKRLKKCRIAIRIIKPISASKT